MQNKVMKVGELAPKSVFAYGGESWVVLDHDGSGGVLCLTEKAYYPSNIDECDHNDWKRESELKTWVEGTFFKGLLENGADENAFLAYEMDLTADDGLIDYGKYTAKIGLISTHQYRMYRYIIPPVNTAWWTCTPWSTKDNGNDCTAMYVAAGCRAVHLHSSPWAVSTYIGVRLAVTVLSDLCVSVTAVAEAEAEVNEPCEILGMSEETQETAEQQKEKVVSLFRQCIISAEERYINGVMIPLSEVSEAIKQLYIMENGLPF